VFRRLVPLIDNCEPPAATAASDAAADSSAEGSAEATPASQPGRHPDRLELQIPVAWVARNGDALLRVAVRSEVYRECDGPRRYPSQLWFYREAQGRVRPLPGQLVDDRADLVAPLEFSDLLRNGGEQVLFMAAAHERGGYVLYTDHFRRRIDYLWAYH
jgi:hypothetical protein